MSTAMMCHKKLAVTDIDAILKRYVMIIIIAVKSKIEFIEEEAIPLLRIPFCLFSFSYHSVVHL